MLAVSKSITETGAAATLESGGFVCKIFSRRLISTVYYIKINTRIKLKTNYLQYKVSARKKRQTILNPE